MVNGLVGSHCRKLVKGIVGDDSVDSDNYTAMSCSLCADTFGKKLFIIIVTDSFIRFEEEQETT